MTQQTLNDPFKRLKNLRNLTTKFFFDVANQDQQALGEYMNCQIPSFITPFLPAYLHLLRCFVQEIDVLEGQNSFPWQQLLNGVSVKHIKAFHFLRVIVGPVNTDGTLQEGVQPTQFMWDIHKLQYGEVELQIQMETFGFPRPTEEQQRPYTPAFIPQQRTKVLFNVPLTRFPSLLKEKERIRSADLLRTQSSYTQSQLHSVPQISHPRPSFTSLMDQEISDESDGNQELDDNLLLQDGWPTQSIHGRVFPEVAQAIEELSIKVLKLPKFMLESNELEKLRNLIIRYTQIQKPEDVIGLLVKKESSDTLSLDRYLTGIQGRVFNLTKLLLATLTSYTGQTGPHPQEIIICAFKTIEISNSIEGTRRVGCLYLSSKAIATTQEAQKRLKELEEEIILTRQPNYDFRPQQ
ncbi:MAG: hypothetical protein EZS28_016863, partial [Streblomastix strix]